MSETIKVLLVDDEPAIGQAFRSHFRTKFEVLTATSAQEANELLENNEMHVIIVDYNMPTKDGIVYLSELVHTYPNITRVLATAHTALHVAIEAINIGAVYRYIQKPWDLMELEILINQCHEYYQLKQDKTRLLDRLYSNERLIALLEEKGKR